MKKYIYAFIITSICLSTSTYGELSDSAIIKYAMQVSAQKIEPTLPNDPLESWLKAMLGPNWTLDWYVDQCGLAGIPLRKEERDHICVVLNCREEGHRIETKMRIADKTKGFFAKPEVLYVGFFQYDSTDTEALYKLSLIRPRLDVLYAENVRLKKLRSQNVVLELQDRDLLNRLALIGGLCTVIIITCRSYVKLTKEIEASLIDKGEAMRRFVGSSIIALMISVGLIFFVNFAARLFYKEWLYEGEMSGSAIGIFVYDFILSQVVTIIYLCLLSKKEVKKS